jgi:hypothetical protein
MHKVKQPDMPKTLHIALVGAANVGKVLNAVDDTI